MRTFAVSIFFLSSRSSSFVARSSLRPFHLKLGSSFVMPSSSPMMMSSSSDAAATASKMTQTTSGRDDSISDSDGGSSSSPGKVTPFVKPPRVVLGENNLPILYVYDHCPFCVRVRMALGLKNVKHTLHFMANDDVPTPTALVGKKIAPILQWKNNNKGEKEDEQTQQDAEVCMAESMDIISYCDSNDVLGPTDAIKPASGRVDLMKWQSESRDLLRRLQRPRYVATGLLPEFQQLESRHAYIRNHAMPPYNTNEWNAMSAEDQIAAYADGMANDPAADIEELNRLLVELDDKLYSEHHCSDTDGISYDDIDLFSRLRSVTIIRNVEWPSRLRNYMDNMAELSDIPLYDEMAL